MGTPRTYNRLLNTQIKMFAAWLPVTNTFRLGDYGLMSGGVFHQIGHISEFLGGDAVGPGNTRSSDNSTTVDLKSEGTVVARTAAGVEVDAFPPAGDVDAEMKIEFTREDSFLVKAKLTREDLDNTAFLAGQLKKQSGWKLKYRVVSSLYKTEGCTVISAKRAGAEIKLGGSASALKALDAASASTEVTYSSNQDIGLEIVGEGGVMGLGLFKLRLLGGGLRVLSNGHAPDDAELGMIELDGPEDLDDNDV
ncbi:hypothetical protein FIU92_02075 [Ruegeria sp. THAF33]|nr:hypothetical protein FIU92_02075 [Ruegeria sp. THAF33]